ncbi:MAG TPA: mechanosensitive ion channel family protein [Longimicrobiales bacterium]|nr:mechanosensitive ion channel family protein [Longimicrobiales bacterium]
MEGLFATDTVFLGNPLRTWLLAAATALIVYIGLKLLRRVLIRYVSRLSRRTATYADDVIRETISRTRVFFIVFASLYAGSRVLLMTPDVQGAVKFLGVVVITLQIAIWGNAILTGVVEGETRKRLAADPNSVTTLGALSFIGRVLLWTVLLLVALENLGVDVTALLTGLGIGGIAVALAVQNILGDLLASLSIVLDKPFEVGDFIVIDDKSGTVERVGLKTSRIRALSGEQLVFSNSDLLSARIQNFKRMYERRIVFSVGVTYATPRERLQQIPDIMRAAIEAQEHARFDRAHFAKYGDFALLFEAVYYVKVPEYNVYMDVQQAINLRMHEVFEASGIEFAFPTQTIILQQQTAQ